jgi:hypothetical protein
MRLDKTIYSLKYNGCNFSGTNFGSFLFDFFVEAHGHKLGEENAVLAIDSFGHGKIKRAVANN